MNLLLNGKPSEDEKEPSEEMFDYINSIIEGENYGIGLHSTQGESTEEILKNIIVNGLKIERGEKILSTVSSFGTHKQISKEYLKQRIMQYSYGKRGETKQNVIILVPSIISNSQGKGIYLGFPPYNIDCYGNNYRTSCVLDTICASEDEKGEIPSEFILGYYTTNGNFSFIKNPNYFKFLSQEQKDKFFTNIEGKLQGKYKIISEAVMSGDIQTLQNLSEEEQEKIKIETEREKKDNILQRGLNNQLAETLSISSVRIKQDDSATQAFRYIERTQEEQLGAVLPLNTNKRHKILLGLYENGNATLQGVNGAKTLLREGLLPKEKTEENEHSVGE